MIHIAIGGVILSLTCLALSFVSLVDPDSPASGGVFMLGSFVALAVSLLFFLYIRRERL